ncbi:MAG: hypothetical protein Q9201_002010 [Fulgogasparrea decipioides]
MRISRKISFLLTCAFPNRTIASSQGTVVLNLATSNEETASSISVPFNALFDASSTPKAVSIQVSSGNNVPIAQEEISCQCFSDRAGTKPLGAAFNNVFPGTELAQEPVKIGSILCSDAASLKKQASSGMAAGDGTASSPAAVEMQATTSSAVEAIATPQSSTSISTAATAPVATPKPKPTSNAQPTSSSGNVPTAIVKFSLSTDPSDDSATQISVPIDNSIASVGGKRAASVAIVTISGEAATKKSELVCQAFGDKKAKEPIAMGFGLQQEMVLDKTGVQVVGSVGCTMVGGGSFGGVIGLVGV